MLIKITEYRAKRRMGIIPPERPKVVVVPPPGVANWKRIDGPYEVPGGQKVIIEARWKVFEPGYWRTLYSDGTIGFPVTPSQSRWRLHRGPKEVFEFQTSDPYNTSFLGETLIFEIEMLIKQEERRRA